MIRRNVLIFHSGGLGDFVLTWPLGLALGRLHPQSRIIYVTASSKGELAAKILRLDWMDAESGWPALYSVAATSATSLNDKCGKTLAEAHSVYTFLSTEADAWSANVAATSPEAKLVSLRVAPPVDFTGHVGDYLLSQLAGAPAVRGAVEQILASIRNRGVGPVHVRGSSGPVFIHSGSGCRQKCYPLEAFIRLIERLKGNGKIPKVILGEVELERFADSEVRELERTAEVVRPARYVDLADLLAGAAGFIGHDSGPGHLAGVIGVPTVALFGPTDPAVWRPMGPKVQVVRGVELNVDAVCEALEQVLGVRE